MPSHPTRRRFVEDLAAAMVLRPRFFNLVRAFDSWVPAPDLLAEVGDLLRLSGVSAMSAAVVEDGEIAWSGAFGMRRADGSQPATESTLFEAGSLTKPLFPRRWSRMRAA